MTLSTTHNPKTHAYMYAMHPREVLLVGDFGVQTHEKAASRITDLSLFGVRIYLSWRDQSIWSSYVSGIRVLYGKGLFGKVKTRVSAVDMAFLEFVEGGNNLQLNLKWLWNEWFHPILDAIWFQKLLGNYSSNAR